MPPATQRQRVPTYVTPQVRDVLFYETAEGIRSDVPEYGTPHPDSSKWPDHVLVYAVVPDETPNERRLYYAARRESQDEYNFEINGNDQLTRTYVIPRSEFSPEGFPHPVVGTPDARFPKYVFASEFQGRIDKELDSVFVAVQRVFSKPFTISYEENRGLDSIVKVTRTIIPAGSEEGSLQPGRTVEISPQNTFFDIRVESELLGYEDDVDEDGFFLRQLPTLPNAVNYQFPPRLNYIQVHGVWAFADSSEAAPSYSEDFFFEMNMTEPSPGPYPGRVLRFITNDPEQVQQMHPIDKINLRRDTFGMLKKWFSASQSGNSTFALARQMDVGRGCIHDDIVLPELINYVEGGSPPAEGGPGRLSLDATEGYAALVASSVFRVAVQPRQVGMSLWEIQVQEIVPTGSIESEVYGGAPPANPYLPEPV
jgi:hypothetical protein